MYVYRGVEFLENPTGQGLILPASKMQSIVENSYEKINVIAK